MPPLCRRPGGSRGLGARLAQRPLPLQPLEVLFHVLSRLGRGRRFHTQAPRHQPEPSSARPRRQGPPPPPGAQCPAPTAAWVTTGATRGTHPSIPAGLTSSKMGKATRSTWAQLSSRAIPALWPRRRVRAKLPGCRYPRRCRPAGQGGADAQVPPHPKLNRGDPIHYEFTLVSCPNVPSGPARLVRQRSADGSRRPDARRGTGRRASKHAKIDRAAIAADLAQA